MPKKCPVCEHKHRLEIDKALVAGSMTYVELDAKYTIGSKTVIGNHKRRHIGHLVKAAVMAAEAKLMEEKKEVEHHLEVHSGLQVLEKLDYLLDEAHRLYLDARGKMDDISETVDSVDAVDSKEMVSVIHNLVKKRSENRRDAMFGIKLMGDLLSKYGEMVRVAHEIRKPAEKGEREPLPPEVEDILQRLGC